MNAKTRCLLRVEELERRDVPSFQWGIGRGMTAIAPMLPAVQSAHVLMSEQANEAVLIGLLAHQGLQAPAGRIATLPPLNAMVFTTKIDWSTPGNAAILFPVF